MKKLTIENYDEWVAENEIELDRLNALARQKENEAVGLALRQVEALERIAGSLEQFVKWDFPSFLRK